MKCLFFVSIVVMLVALSAISFYCSNANALVVNNSDFSIDIPDNWTYVQDMFSVIALTPKEFGLLLVNHTEPLSEKMKNGGAFASFREEKNLPIKNAGLDVYVEYKIGKLDGMNVSSKMNVTLGEEEAVRIQGDGIKKFDGIEFTEYMLMHNEQPYIIGYMANAKDFENYLPEFEDIVKSFKFID